ncbi:hypothetical protein [Kitasatospora cheerisanensis]|uniref:Uncharacterized protein n=1 Tax=Kitasatospora cheerisanensis KCTC 2395 TaxID=1348663 RepID=A0A066YZT1_9ACTN|nr:hypothetical protein [Kitasatospora cheerisanensis]KDN83440.1 hypothetical protein KCH_49220 [Kitasatospora cheerisanensis KCTC 2395]
MPHRGKSYLEGVVTDDGPEVVVWVLESLVSEDDVQRLERELQHAADQLAEELDQAA